jgi:hypothetical protein
MRTRFYKLLLFLPALLSFASCATKTPNNRFDSIDFSHQSNAYRQGQTLGEAEDVNGFLPARVWIKTRTQTFYKKYSFCVVDGRLYYKGNLAGTDVPSWKLLAGSGLPHSDKKGFHPVRRVAEISADGDTLFAISDEGRFYQCYVEKLGTIKPLIWSDTFGWPNRLPLSLNDLVSQNAAWSLGTRRKDVLWHEDVNGNEHNWGTSGIETLYFLNKNGQELRYADTGLPCDFSHGLLGPERGSFIAKAMSASCFPETPLACR